MSYMKDMDRPREARKLGASEEVENALEDTGLLRLGTNI